MTDNDALNQTRRLRPDHPQLPGPERGMSIEPIAMGEIQPEATLEDCEQALHTVERNAAIQQGVILRHVRNHRLYSAAGFPSFAEYVEQRLGYTDRWARQRIDLADTVAAIGTMVPDHAIENERQARVAIKPILRDHGPEVAADVLAEAEASGKITARSITEAAERVIEPEVISAEEFVERYDADNEPTPDLDTLIPTDQRFRLRFAKRLQRQVDANGVQAETYQAKSALAKRLLSLVDDAIAAGAPADCTPRQAAVFLKIDLEAWCAA